MQPAHLEFRFVEAGEGGWLSKQIQSQLGVGGPAAVGWRWVVTSGPRVEVYLVPANVASSYERLLRARMPYFLGLFVGILQGRKLNVSLELASYVSRQLPARKIVILTSEAEQPILYGRDVLAGSVGHIDRGVKKDELVVLENTQNEVLALGKMLMDAKGAELAAPHQRVIRNLIDKGWYLRKGG